MFEHKNMVHSGTSIVRDIFSILVNMVPVKFKVQSQDQSIDHDNKMTWVKNLQNQWNNYTYNFFE